MLDPDINIWTVSKAVFVYIQSGYTWRCSTRWGRRCVVWEGQPWREYKLGPAPWSLHHTDGGWACNATVSLIRHAGLRVKYNGILKNTTYSLFYRSYTSTQYVNELIIRLFQVLFFSKNKNLKMFEGTIIVEREERWLQFHLIFTGITDVLLLYLVLISTHAAVLWIIWRLSPIE